MAASGGGFCLTNGADVQVNNSACRLKKHGGDNSGGGFYLSTGARLRMTGAVCCKYFKTRPTHMEELYSSRADTTLAVSGADLHVIVQDNVAASGERALSDEWCRCSGKQ